MAGRVCSELRKLVLRVFLVLLALSSIAMTGVAQSQNSDNCSFSQTEAPQSVTGVITDPSGAVIPSVTIQVSCGRLHEQAQTDRTGSYQLRLRPGDYQVTVTAPGFATISQTLSVSASETSAPVDFKMKVGNIGSSVTVTGDAGYVAIDSSVGTKTETPLLETPQSITVITRDLMDSQAPQTINEALRYAPGVVPESQGTTSSFWNSSSLQLRGFIPDLYQDGLADDATGNNLLDAYFYQNVEILEGPSSTLYGQGSLAGIVNVETKRPRATALHELQFGTGTYGRYEGNFDFSGPLASPHLLYRLTGVGFSEGSQTWFIHPERYAIAPALTWLPDSKTSLTLLSNYTYNPQVGAYANVPALGSALYNPHGKIAAGFFGGDPNFNMTKQSFIQAGDVFSRSFGDGWRLEQNFRFTGNRDYAKMIWPEDLESDNETLNQLTPIARHCGHYSFVILRKGVGQHLDSALKLTDCSLVISSIRERIAQKDAPPACEPMILAV